MRALRGLIHRLVRRSNGERRDRGQVIVIFASASFVLLLLLAVVIDISWLWANSLKIQRAADAAALAGAVTLPNDEPRGVTLASNEARKNGYIAGSGVVVNPRQDPANANRMVVTITAPVPTFFARMVGINTFTVSRTARAEYNLPLKMGSPQNYYGVGQFNVPSLGTDVDNDDGDTDWRSPDLAIISGLPDAQMWIAPHEANDGQNNDYASETFTGHSQRWEDWDLQGGGGGNVPTPGTTMNNGLPTVVTVDITSVRVRLNDIRLRPTSSQNPPPASTNCTVLVEVWFENAATVANDGRWVAFTPVTLTSVNDTDFTLPLAADSAMWNALDWRYDDLTNGVLEVRLTWQEGVGCGSPTVDRSVELDSLEVRIAWESQTTETIKNPPTPQSIVAPDGTVLAPQNFWAAMQSYGAPAVQGDAHMTGFTTRTSVANAEYDPTGFYNYAVEIPVGATGGEVWIFDPAFCDTGLSSNGRLQGTGEDWTTQTPNGSTTVRHVNAYYELFDMQETPYDRSDDVRLAWSDQTFVGPAMNQSDPFLNGNTNAANSCENYAYHPNLGSETQASWWKIPAAPLGPGLYRVHTASRMPTDATSDQLNATGLNAFAIWAKTVTGAAPKVYGLGAMEAYFALPAGVQSNFYLAQIERQYAGKWLDIDLWDPGDTGGLDADLQIMYPTGTSGGTAGGGYSFATFYQEEITGTTIPANTTCGPSTSSAKTIVATSNGGGAIYNGQWLRLCVQVPTGYTAPKPNGEPAGGWWKIKYIMSGNSGDTPSTDLTTWKVTVRDNPVHLVVD